MRKSCIPNIDVLSVYLHDEIESLRFRLIGSLSGPDAADFERSWRTAQSTLNGRLTVVDLSEVQSADEAGRQVLRRIASDGARFITGSAVSDALARDISMREPDELSSSKLSAWRMIQCWILNCCHGAQDVARRCQPCWQRARRIW